MSNSPLVVYTKLSPNHSGKRTSKISKITIHHMAGNASIEACGNIFASPSRKASSNYGIGSDGRIGMYVEEKNRSWCSSSSWNDQQAVTIEVANDRGNPDWHVSDKAFNALIDLCVDICKRNGFRLSYDGTKNGSLTRHNMFSATGCPGPYLQGKFPEIVKLVNARLDGGSNNQPNPPKPTSLEIGDIVAFKGGMHYVSATSTSGSPAKAGLAKITNIAKSGKHLYHIVHTNNQSNVYGWVDGSTITKQSSSNNQPSSKFEVGNLVMFRGGKQYKSATSTKGSNAKAGPARITYTSKTGKHKYHIVHTDKTSNVYGWVDESTIYKK